MNDVIAGQQRRWGAGDNLRELAHRIVDFVWPFFFGVGISGGAFWAASRDAQQQGNGQAQFWLSLWFLLALLFVVVRLVFNWLKERSRRIRLIYKRDKRRMRGAQYAAAGWLAIIFLVMTAWFGLSRWLLWLAPLLFMPGMIILVKRFSLADRSDRSGLFPRPVTRRAFGYTAITAFSVLSAAMVSVLLDPSGSDPGSDVLTIVSFGLVPSLCTFVVLMGVYAVMRQSNVSQLQTELLTRHFEQIIQQNNYAKLWQEVAQRIQQFLYLERVTIIVPDVHYHCALRAATPEHRERRIQAAEFHIKGFAGRGREKLEQMNYPMKGIARSVLKGMKPRNVPDVNADPDYFANGLTDTRSELYVPICDLYREEAIALIVAQAPRRSAFSRQDEDNVQRVADYLASFSRHLWHSSSYQRLHDEIQRLGQPSAADFRNVLRAVRNTFQTECVAYIPLAFATYRPILDGAQALHEGFTTAFAPDPKWLDASSGIPGLIRSWSPVLNVNVPPDATPNDATGCSLCDWARRERLEAFAIAPVGRSGAGGLFIIGFRESMEKDEAHLRTLLNAFANQIAPFIDGDWQHWWQYETTFVAPTIEMHQILNRHSLGHNHWETSLCQAAQGDLRSLNELCANVKSLVTELYDLEAISHPLGQDGSLANAVAAFKESLQGRYAFDAIHHVDWRLEKESPELKTMLYRIMCEGMLNALFHGHASHVYLIALRRQRTIELLICDKGDGFDVCTLQQLGERKHGMLVLCRRLSELTGAPAIDWLGTAPKRGTCLKISIPCLTLDDALDEATTESVKWERRFNRLEKLYEPERSTSGATDD